MTNFEKLKNELTPKMLSEIVYCALCPAGALCDKRRNENRKNGNGYSEWSCEKVFDEWCAMEAEDEQG